VLQILQNVARDHTGLPLLRCYWYEATVEGRRSTEHETLADLPGVKLRLGKMKPGRREGVESEIHRDLTTLARNRAISDALVVSAEEDLAQVIADVQDLGLRVILVHIAAPGCTAAAVLRQECDDIVAISEAHLRPSVELVVGAEPVSEEERQVVAGYASRAPANGHGPHGVIGQPGLPAAAQAPPPAIYTGSVIAEYQRAAQPMNSHRPALAEAAGPPGAGSQGLAGAPGAQPGTGPAQPGMAPPPGAVSRPGTPGQPAAGQGGLPGPRGITGQPALPPAVGQPAAPAQPAGSQPGTPAPQTGLAGPPPPAVPGHHAATPGHHAAPGQHAATQGHHAAPGPPMMPPGQPGRTHISGPLAAPVAPQHAQSLPRGGGQYATPPAAQSESGPAVQGQPGLPPLPPQPIQPGQPVPGAAMPGQPAPGPQPAPAAPVAAQGFQPHAGLPGPQPRQGAPAYQAAPPPPPPPPAPAPPAALAPPAAPAPPAVLAPAAALAPPAAPSGFPDQAPDMTGGPAPAAPRPPTAGAPPGPMAPPPPAGAGVPALSAVRPGAQLRGVPGGYPVGPPAQPVDQRLRQLPAVPSQPGGEPYVPQQGPHSGPQPVAQHALVPQPVAVSLADAVQAAHGEGFNFGQGVARDAPALWLEAVLARKPRMPSDLEARLLQDSSLPIDSLLHDEVRHALRRGFWDALERVRH
jgi:hypothetical protein